MNLREFICDYYSVYRKIDLKDGTIRSYLSTLCRIPEDWELETVSREDLQKLINSLSNELSTSTVRHVFGVISKVIREASVFGFPDRTQILNGIRLPASRKKLVGTLSEAEISLLQTSRYWDIYDFLLNTGLRFSEMAGLNCSDVDFKNRSAYVQRNYYRGQLYTSLKTYKSVRSVPLNAEAYRIAMKHYKIGSGSLFTSEKGSRISYNTIQKDFKHYGFDFGIHSLRHTFATRLLLMGVDLTVVSNILGHSSIAITADIYTHVPQDFKLEAVEKLCSNLG